MPVSFFQLFSSYFRHSLFVEASTFSLTFVATASSSPLSSLAAAAVLGVGAQLTRLLLLHSSLTFSGTNFFINLSDYSSSSSCSSLQRPQWPLRCPRESSECRRRLGQKQYGRNNNFVMIRIVHGLTNSTGCSAVVATLGKSRGLFRK